MSLVTMEEPATFAEVEKGKNPVQYELGKRLHFFLDRKADAIHISYVYLVAPPAKDSF
jgi:hypothetical protein